LFDYFLYFFFHFFSFYFCSSFFLWGSGGSVLLGTKVTGDCWTRTCFRPPTFRFSVAMVWDAFYFSWAGRLSLAPEDIFPDQWFTKEIRRPLILIGLRKHQITFHLYLISFSVSKCEHENKSIKLWAFPSMLRKASCIKEVICATESSCVWGLGLGIIWEYLNPGQIFCSLSVKRSDFDSDEEKNSSFSVNSAVFK